MELGPDPLKVITPLTYVVGGVGLWKLVHWFFEFPEKHLAPELKDTVSRLLLEARLASSVEKLPETFAKIFDVVFTKKHLSWTCFWRS